MKKKLELAYLNTRYSKLSVKSEGIQNDLDILRESLKLGHVDRNVYVRSLTKEKTLNRGTCFCEINYNFIRESKKTWRSSKDSRNVNRRKPTKATKTPY